MWYIIVINPSAAETGIFRVNQVNTIAIGALAACRQGINNVLTVEDKRVTMINYFIYRRQTIFYVS